MYGTTTIAGKLKCSGRLTILYQDEYPNPGILVLGDCLYHALCDATGDRGGVGAPHVLSGRAKITARYGLSPLSEFALVLYDVNSYSFIRDGSDAEFTGALPNRAQTKVELWANGRLPIVRFEGEQLPAMAVNIDTICSLHSKVKRLADENDSSVSREEIQRDLFSQIQWLYNKMQEGLNSAGDLNEVTPFHDPMAIDDTGAAK